MFSWLTAPVMSTLAWAALAAGLTAGSFAGYHTGHYLGDSAGYARAQSEAKIESEKAVANALELIARDRRNRVNDGLPVDGADSNDRR